MGLPGAGPGQVQGHSERLVVAIGREELQLVCEPSLSTPAALLQIARLALPMASSMLFTTVPDRCILAFVGTWASEDRAGYDGAGLGKMYSNVTGLSLGIAANIGLATLCSQAHGRGLASELNPVYVRRAFIVLMFAFGFSLAAALVCEHVLLAMSQPAAVALTSARFAQVQLTGLPFWWATGAAKMALDAIKCPSAGLFAYGLSSVVQLVLAVVFIHPRICGLGYLGMALSRALGGVASAVAMAAFIWHQKLQPMTWRLAPGHERILDAGAIRAYLAVTVPSALILWSEWWAFEVLALLVGRTKNAEVNLGAHSTMVNIIVPIYMMFIGVSQALCALVGIKLGEGLNADIRPLLRSGVILSAMISVMVSVGYEVFKDQIAAMFTQDADIRAVLGKSSLGLVLSIPLYAQLMTLYGALRGANKQRQAIIGTTVGYWIVGLPLGGILGCIWLWPTPLVGVWLGNVTALSIAAAWVSIVTFFVLDWEGVRPVTSSRDVLTNSTAGR